MVKTLNIILLVLNALLLLAGVYYYSSHAIQHVYYDIEYKDLVAIMLTAISVILTAVTIIISLLAIFGFSAIKSASIDAAISRAETVARETAGPVAAREAQAAVALYREPLDVATRDEDELTGVLSKKRPNDNIPGT